MGQFAIVLCLYVIMPRSEGWAYANPAFYFYHFSNLPVTYKPVNSSSDRIPPRFRSLLPHSPAHFCQGKLEFLHM